jgi:hypothetical protein
VERASFFNHGFSRMNTDAGGGNSTLTPSSVKSTSEDRLALSRSWKRELVLEMGCHLVENRIAGPTHGSISVPLIVVTSGRIGGPRDVFAVELNQRECFNGFGVVLHAGLDNAKGGKSCRLA